MVAETSVAHWVVGDGRDGAGVGRLWYEAPDALSRLGLVALVVDILPGPLNRVGALA